MEPLVIILLCLTASYLLSEFFEGLKLPRVLGSLLVGVVLGLPVVYQFLFTPSSIDLLKAFSDLGLIFLMFYVGLQLEFSDIKKDSKKAVHVAIFSSLLPFLLGFICMRLLGFDNLAAIIVGACLSVTAEAVSIDILAELNILKTRLGEIIVAAGTLDDIVEVLLVSLLVTFIHSMKNPGLGIFVIILDIIIFFILVYFAGYFLIPFVLKFISKKRQKIDLFVFSLILSLFMATASEYLGIGSLLGALLAGMTMRYSLVKSKGGIMKEKQITEIIEITTFGFMAPFFFIWIGMQSDFTFLLTNPLLGIVVTLAAFGGKLFGSVIGNWIGKGSLLEGITIGWGMNTRGEVELIAAELARQSSLISNEVFSALVFMAFTTTIISPILFKFYITKYHLKGSVS